MSAEKSARGWRGDRPTAVLLISVTLVHLIHYLSSPLVVEGDGVCYWAQMSGDSFHASLLCSPGYPFFFHLLYSPFRLLGWPLGDFLRFTQQFLWIPVTLFAFRGLRRLLPPWVALVPCLLLGTDFLTTAHSSGTRPEFFQAMVGLFLLGSVVRGQTAAGRAKTGWYFLAGISFALAYLVKFNSIVYLVVFLAILGDRLASGRQRLGLGFAAGLGAALFLVGYAHFFHRPTTGTYRLNMEHGWIHMERLLMAGIPVEMTSGPHSRRYLVLSRRLPPPTQRFGNIFQHVDQVPTPERALAEPLWQAAQDERWLAEQYRELGSPPTDYRAFMRMYYHLGLARSEALLLGVFREGLKAHPGRYLKDLNLKFHDVIYYRRHYTPLLPHFVFGPPQLSPWYFDGPGCMGVGEGDPRLEPPGSWWLPVAPFSQCNEVYTYGPPRIFKPGLMVLEIFSWLNLLPELLIWAVIAWGGFRMVRARRRGEPWSPAAGWFAISVIALLGTGLFAILVYCFRVKELASEQLFFYLALALAGHAIYQHRRARCGATH